MVILPPKCLITQCLNFGGDYILGFPYDAACFTLFQEKMLLELREYYPTIKMGHYYHFVSSMHVYKKHYPMIERISKNYHKDVRIVMPRMKDTLQIKKLQYNEEVIRTKSSAKMKKLTDDFCIWCQNILLNNRK